MKLRIRENAIRLRLKRSEVEQIVSGRSIVEETHFPDSVLTYRLEVSDDGRPSASFDKGNLTIRLPDSEIVQWARTMMTHFRTRTPSRKTVANGL